MRKNLIWEIHLHLILYALQWVCFLLLPRKSCIIAVFHFRWNPLLQTLEIPNGNPIHYRYYFLILYCCYQGLKKLEKRSPFGLDFIFEK